MTVLSHRYLVEYYRYLAQSYHIGDHILYADDTCVLLNGKDYLSLIASLNSELDKLSIWLCANKLSLNVQKTYFIGFSQSKNKNSHSY